MTDDADDVVPDDGYNAFRRLGRELAARSREAWAAKLADALAAGSTSSECLGEAGQVLRSLYLDERTLIDAELAAEFTACADVVEAVWPRLVRPGRGLFGW